MAAPTLVSADVPTDHPNEPARDFYHGAAAGESQRMTYGKKSRKSGQMRADGRNEAPEFWTKMLRATMDTPAWRALTPAAQALYPWLKFEWRGPKTNNNGAIRLSVRQAAERLGVTPDRAARAFHELQAKGFIVQIEGASLGTSGAAKSPAYEITELVRPSTDEVAGRKWFRDWRPGRDFPVMKAVPHNPKGRNGKTKPCHENHDGTVINLMTKPRKPSSKS